jgi:hypothetical protein
MAPNDMRRLSRTIYLIAFALAASVPCFPDDEPRTTLHNVVLFVPEVLPAAGVDAATAPTLARLRTEGVNFMNSHSGFPRLNSKQPLPLSADFDIDSLVSAAGARYSIAVIDESRVGADPASHDLGAALKVLLPQYKEANRPFVLVFRMGERRDEWVDDPNDQSNPPPPWLRNVRAADEVLATIERSLKEVGVYDDTNIIVAAEHGVSRIWKASATSPSLKVAADLRPADELPPGFLAIDLISALTDDDPRLSLFDADNGNKRLDWQLGEHPQKGNALIGADPSDPDVRIEAYGGHDALYLPERISKQEGRRMGLVIVAALMSHDYVSGVFIDESRIGKVPGALSIDKILPGSQSHGRRPDIVVGFASANIGCDRPTVCTAMISDTPLEEGGTIPGHFSRSDTWNFMAARGPDFRTGYVDRAPASNADIGVTIAHLMQIDRRAGKAGRRVLVESLSGSEGKSEPVARQYVVESRRSEEDDLVTQVRLQAVGSAIYFDAAGFPGWTVGLKEEASRDGARWSGLHWPKWRTFTISITPD